MSYISKDLLIKAYRTLSNLTVDHLQGQTQIVSALRYVVALDMFYRINNRECKLDNISDKNAFTANVNFVVNICDDFYTANFYTTIEEYDDCRVGSNFYSAGVVAKSKVSPLNYFNYPLRGSYPLFKVKANTLYREEQYYENVSNYLPNEQFKAAFVVWLLRNNSVSSFHFDEIKKCISELVTAELAAALLPNEATFNVFVNGFVLQDDKPKVYVQDLVDLFIDENNDSNEMSHKDNTTNKTMQQPYRTQTFLAALRTKPFMLLAGISGTGKSRIVRKLAQASVNEELQSFYDPKSVASGFDRWKLHKPANFELIQVKPNWHNSLEVVGYKSNIGGAHYEFTPFVEFVARAWKHQDVPFFLCLDEMNLAPVEQYFAEFLSAIESRSFENDEYETDPIIKPFKNFGDEVCKQMLDHLIGKMDASGAVPGSPEAKLIERFMTKGLTLPKNLLVLGTVNMDETTFSFSRKVLDRAMSVVMNEVEYDKFFRGETENDVAEMSKDALSFLIDRPINGLVADNNHIVDVEKYLTDINTLLDNTPFKLGYRAANEALLYVSSAYKFDPQANIHVVLDEFTMMKILSRIEGDKRSLGNLLYDLRDVITDEYPKSYEKLKQMATTLNSKQFVSYWT